MKILIDGCVFTQLNQTETLQFWRQVIPPLVSQLQGHQIYFLNRTQSAAFPEIGSCKNLFAPVVDFENFATETCRLSALCKELDIDLFISTYNTSAGSQAKSLFVLGEQLSQANFVGEDAVLISRQRAIKMACGYLILYLDAAQTLDAMGILKQDRVWLAYSSEKPSLESLIKIDEKAVAKGLEIALHQLFDYKPTAEVMTQLKAQEEAVKAEAMQIKLLAEEAVKDKVMYPNYKPEKPKKFARYFMYVSWIYQALKQPGKYPKYLSKIYQLLMQKLRLSS